MYPPSLIKWNFFWITVCPLLTWLYQQHQHHPPWKAIRMRLLGVRVEEQSTFTYAGWKNVHQFDFTWHFQSGNNNFRSLQQRRAACSVQRKPDESEEDCREGFVWQASCFNDSFLPLSSSSHFSWSKSQRRSCRIFPSLSAMIIRCAWIALLIYDQMRPSSPRFKHSHSLKYNFKNAKLTAFLSLGKLINSIFFVQVWINQSNSIKIYLIYFSVYTKVYYAGLVL